MTSSQRLSVTVIGDRMPDLDLPQDRRDEGGSGWVRRLGHLLALHLREREIALTDATEPGSTLHKVRERWTDDVLLPRPDVLLVQVGLSDAWGICEKNNPYAAEPAGVIAILDDLLARCRDRCPATRVILVEPLVPSIDTAGQRIGPVATALRPQVAALRDLAARLGLAWLPAGELVAAAKRRRNDDQWLGYDGFSGLDTCGSMLLADAALRLIAGLGHPTPCALADGQRFVLVGDSITDAGRRSEARPMGCGYARLLQGLLAARNPGTVLEMVNSGIGGDTIVDIESRWERDALRHRPDWLLLYTGINDLNSVYGKRTAVTPELYQAGLERCLRRSREANPALQLVIVAPFVLSRDDHPGSYRNEVVRRLPGYITAAATVARTLDARFVDLHAAILPLQDRFGNRALCGNRGADTVHPSELGCLAIAESIATALNAG